jgi:hypothetical protein
VSISLAQYNSNANISDFNIDIKNLSTKIIEGIKGETIANKKDIVIIDFCTSRGIVNSDGEYLTSKLSQYLVSQSIFYKYNILNMDKEINIKQQLVEKNIKPIQLADPQISANFGRQIFADLVITGSLNELADKRGYGISVNIIKTDNATVLKTINVQFLAVSSNNQPVPTVVTPRNPPLPPKVSSPPTTQATEPSPSNDNQLSLFLERAKKIQIDISKLSEKIISKHPFDVNDPSQNREKALVIFDAFIKDIKPLTDELKAIQNKDFIVPRNAFSCRIGDPLPNYDGFLVEAVYDYNTYKGIWNIKDSVQGQSLSKITRAIECEGRYRLVERKDSVVVSGFDLLETIFGTTTDFIMDIDILAGLKSARMMQVNYRNDIEPTLAGAIMKHPSIKKINPRVELNKFEYSSAINGMEQIELAYQILKRQ